MGCYPAQGSLNGIPVSLTPWTENIDAAGFNLFDLGILTFQNGTIQETALNLVYNIPGAQQHQFQVAGVLQMSIDAAEINIFDNGLRFTTAGTTIRRVTDDLEYDVDNGQTHRWRVNNVTELELSSTELILGTNILQFQNTNVSIQASGASNLELDVPTGGFFNLRINNAVQYSFDLTRLDLKSNDLNLDNGQFIQWGLTATRRIRNDGLGFEFEIPVGDNFDYIIATVSEYTIDATALTLLGGNNLVIVGSGATGFMDIGEITTPANPGANVGRLYVKDVTATTTLFFRDSAGVETDLLAGGGSDTPWTEDHDADGFDLVDISNLEFRVSTGEPAGTVVAIFQNSINDLVYNVGTTGDDHIFTLAGNVRMQITNAQTIFSHDIFLQQTNQLIFDTLQIINADSNSMNFNVPTSDSFVWNINTVLQLQLDVFAGLNILSNRLNQAKGADVASGGIVTLGNDGNTFDITGVTTINEILGTSWTAGAVIHLQFDGVLTVTNNSGGTNDIITADGANITTSAGFVLTLYFDGTDWIELSRNTVGGGGEVFTWTANHDTGGFNLTFSGDPTDPAGTVAYIHASAINNEMKFNVPTNDNYEWNENGVRRMFMENTNNFLDLLNLDLHFLTGGIIEWGNQPQRSISNDTSGTTFQVQAADDFEFRIGGALEFQITGAGITLPAGNDLITQGAGSMIASLSTQLLAFWGSTPVVQQTVGADTLANLYVLLRAIGIVG